MDEQLDDSQPLPETKAELLDRIEVAHAALDEALARLSDTQLVAPGPYEGWSVKDHLAHLAAWEDGIAALLRKEPRFLAMGLSEEEYLSNDADGANAIICERNKGRSLEDVRVYFARSQQALLNALGPLDEADLRQTYSHYQPDEPGEESGAPIVRWIAGNTYEHYAEHQEWIEALVEP